MPQPAEPTPEEGPDPIESADPDVLQPEILRLRDALLGAEAHGEVLDDRVAELEAQVEQLGADNAALHADLARNPLTRVARGVARRIGMGR